MSIDVRRRAPHLYSLIRVKTVGHAHDRLEAVQRQGGQLSEVLLCVPLADLQLEAGALRGRVDDDERFC